MEKWNLYNEKGELLPAHSFRGAPLPEGAYHMACEVLIRHADGDFLAMIRSTKKRDFGGLYEFSAGGAALYGESELDCVIRECREETGLRPRSFEKIAYTLDREKKIIIHSFIATVECPKDSVTLQEGETDGYLWLSPEEFKEIIKTDRVINRQMKRLDAYFRQNGWK
ncbi:MAG: NUDIX hydrolase [Clostridia bacterium]|nr:NUDIX hydrolase [Clostridia bacterium]